MGINIGQLLRMLSDFQILFIIIAINHQGPNSQMENFGNW